MRSFLFLFICFSGLSLLGQEESNWNLYKPTPANTEQIEETEKVREARSIVLESKRDTTRQEKGEIRYIQEERISILDDYMRSNPIKHDGFRIQLKTGNRSEVASARSMFLSRWSYSAYEDFLAPNFRLRVGDFMTRFQAEKALHDLKSQFPNAYIVSDKIEVPREFR